MNLISTMLKGKKTYIGLIIALIGVFGVGQYITPVEGTTLVNNIWSTVGILMAIYGRIVTTK